MAWKYTDKTRQLFMDAVQGKEGTHMGELENPDGLGEHGSIVCGDALRFTFRVRRDPENPENDVITAARYLTFGCTSAIASSEALCALLEEKQCTPLEALEITNRDLIDYLGGLPQQKIHCSVMGEEALEAAVYNWAAKRGVDMKKHGLDEHTAKEREGRVVCRCFSVTEPYLRRKIKELNLKTIADITNATKAGGACMTCHHEPGGLQDLLDEIWGEEQSGTAEVESPELPTNKAEAVSAEEEQAGGKEEMSFYQFCKKVESVIDEYIRPQLQQDNGDIEVVDIKENRLVYCRLKGACAGCAGAATTLKMTVESTLKEQVDEHLRLIAV
ncbi:MAG: iron-sulfur cluster assembly scaffold protein [Verrucomicrobiota bacterium]